VVSCRQRVILMAWRAPGNSRWLTWAVFTVRVSARPCPLSRARLPSLPSCREAPAPPVTTDSPEGGDGDNFPR
jgi:hypothetical protein